MSKSHSSIVSTSCFLFVAAALSFPILGCGGTTNSPASGTITVKGGIPLDEGRLILMAEPEGSNGPTCGATIGKDGTFTCYAAQGGEGIPPGTYKVLLSFSSGKGAINPYQKALDKYTRAATTPLKVTIPPGGKTDIHLEVEEAEEATTEDSEAKGESQKSEK